MTQQNAHLLEGMDKAVEIRLIGLCGRTLHVGGADVAAHITSDSGAFVGWVTQRGTWEGLGVHAEGDRSTLEIIRQLRVF